MYVYCIQYTNYTHIPTHDFFFITCRTFLPLPLGVTHESMNMYSMMKWTHYIFDWQYFSRYYQRNSSATIKNEGGYLMLFLNGTIFILCIKKCWKLALLIEYNYVKSLWKHLNQISFKAPAVYLLNNFW